MVKYFNIILTHRSWIAKNMKKTNSAIIVKLKLILRSMDRLREGFRLEKESALEGPDTGELEKLRERSKSVYQMEIVEYARDIRRLKRSIDSDQAGLEEAEDMAELCAKEAAAIHAHFVSSPNRLIRSYRAGGLSEKGR